MGTKRTQLVVSAVLVAALVGCGGGGGGITANAPGVVPEPVQAPVPEVPLPPDA